MKVMARVMVQAQEAFRLFVLILLFLQLVFIIELSKAKIVLIFLGSLLPISVVSLTLLSKIVILFNQVIFVLRPFPLIVLIFSVKPLPLPPWHSFPLLS